MAEDKRPLPSPERKKRFGEAAPGGMLAEGLAMAAMQGRLDEFIKEHIPDNEGARALAAMMAGMSGMPPGIPGPAIGPGNAASPQSEGKNPEVPEDVLKAAEAGDMECIMGLLVKEHGRRTGGENKDQKAGAPPGKIAGHGSVESMGAVEKEVIDSLIGIARENGLSVDWLVTRALKVYVSQYKKTGLL